MSKEVRLKNGETLVETLEEKHEQVSIRAFAQISNFKEGEQEQLLKDIMEEKQEVQKQLESLRTEIAEEKERARAKKEEARLKEEARVQEELRVKEEEDARLREEAEKKEKEVEEARLKE